MAVEQHQKRTIPFWGTAFTLIGVIVLCFLGYWQVQRYGWKQELLSKINAQYELDASNVPLELGDIENYGGLKRGYFVGRYHHTLSILLQPRTHNGIAGYDVLTPFTVGGPQGFAFLVNRGWVPHERERSKFFLMDMPMGDIKITGMLRRPPRHNAFTPENDPERGVWYRVDINQIALYQKIALDSRVVFYVDSEANRERDYPVSSSNSVMLSNNHIQYAIFWFAMAFFLAVIYFFRFFKKA